MTATATIEWAALAALLFCSAFFSSAEMALFTLTPTHVGRIRQTRPRTADRIARLLASPTRILSTILIGNTTVNIAASSVGYVIAERLFPRQGVAVAIPAMTVLLLLLGEATPKRFAASRAERLAVLYAAPLSALIGVLLPARVMLERFVALFAADLRAADKSLTEDELRSVYAVGEEEGVLGRLERSMVDNIIGLEDMQASQIMTPRVDLVGIDLDDPPEGRAGIARGVTFRFLPVYRGNLDHPEGFLNVTRYLLSPEQPFEAAVEPAYFVPETASLDILLTTFQKEGRRVAFVADEYGGTAGLVTMGDILEEIVPEVEDEFVKERLTVQKMAENMWIVDGSTSLEEINQEVGTGLVSEGADRIAGWMQEQTGRIAHTGDAVEAQGCRVTVHRTRKQRIVTVFLEKSPAPAGEDIP
ncbi:MAG: HlyC/CorC family transporter [Lentisphaerae bacterium]|nr:HlyC/CorC family transporter [Lentisphaerota bacterium]